jgi:nucleotide-binding universal stress UspA family protein
MVATDFSPGAARAVERAARLPMVSGGRLLVLHVLPQDLPAQFLERAENEARAAMEEAGRLAQKAASSAGNHGVTVEGLVVRGDPASEIGVRARVESAELIVLGRHAHRRVRDAFLGSVAHRVGRTADLPVLVVTMDPSVAYERPAAAIDLGATARQTLDELLRLRDPVRGHRFPRVRLVEADEVGKQVPQGSLRSGVRVHESPPGSRSALAAVSTPGFVQ